MTDDLLEKRGYSSLVRMLNKARQSLLWRTFVIPVEGEIWQANPLGNQFHHTRIVPTHLCCLTQKLLAFLCNSQVAPDLYPNLDTDRWQVFMKIVPYGGSTRAGIRNLLDAAQGMVEELEKQKLELVMHTIDRDKVHAEYEKVLDWCKQVKSERQELTYTQKRDFLHMLGATILVYKQEYPGAEPTWDIRVALPTVQEIIYQSDSSVLGDSLSRDRSERAVLRRFSSRFRWRCRP
jgi:hypothetical protein